METTFCTTTLLSEQNVSSTKPVIYPNPSAGLVTLRIPEDPAEQCLVSVYNLNGQLKYSDTFHTRSRIELHLEQLTDGLYLVCIQTAGKTYCEKLSILH